MGNVFTNAGDAWISAIRIHQPDRDTCKNLATVGDPATYLPTGPTTSTGTQGQCGFNYFSHAPGLGLRYHTPVGPIRLDFSYNLNTPIYPSTSTTRTPIRSHLHTWDRRPTSTSFSASDRLSDAHTLFNPARRRKWTPGAPGLDFETGD
jgi:hypothetical protein